MFFVLVSILLIGISTYSQSKQDKAKTLYLEANELTEAGRFSESNTKLYEVKKMMGNNIAIQRLIVKNTFGLKQYENAKKEIQVFLNLNPPKNETYDEVMGFKSQINQIIEKQKQEELDRKQRELEKSYVYHTTTSNETLNSIAQKYGMTTDALYGLGGNAEQLFFQSIEKTDVNKALSSGIKLRAQKPSPNKISDKEIQAVIDAFSFDETLNVASEAEGRRLLKQIGVENIARDKEFSKYPFLYGSLNGFYTVTMSIGVKNRYLLEILGEEVKSSEFSTEYSEHYRYIINRK